VQIKKWEMNETRFAQTAFISDPFSALHNRQRLQREERESSPLASGFTTGSRLVFFLIT